MQGLVQGLVSSTRCVTLPIGIPVVSSTSQSVDPPGNVWHSSLPFGAGAGDGADAGDGVGAGDGAGAQPIMHVLRDARQNIAPGVMLLFKQRTKFSSQPRRQLSCAKSSR